MILIKFQMDFMKQMFLMIKMYFKQFSFIDFSLQMHFDGRNATFVITEAFPKDAGTYTLIARNKAGEAVSSCNVSVKGRLPLETS